MMKSIAFVPVRKGSKGILEKNIRLLGGKPLLCWILDTLVQSSFFSEIWLATDCGETEKMAIGRYGKKVKVYHRSDDSATDRSSVMEVIKEFVVWREPSAQDWFCLFQTTSPFTAIDEMKRMLDMADSGEYDSIVSCVRLKKFRWSDAAAPVDYSFADKPLRQDYKGFLVESGSFYSAPVRRILSEPYILSGRVGIVEVNPALAIDIDEPRDWVEAEYIADNNIFGL